MAVALFTESFRGRDVLASFLGWERGLLGRFRVVCLVARSSVVGLWLWRLGALVGGFGAGGRRFAARFGDGGVGLGGGFGGLADLRARWPLVIPALGLVAGGRCAV